LYAAEDRRFTTTPMLNRLTDLLFETDFKGQQLADRTYQWVIVVFSVIAFVAGFAQESLRVAFQVWLVGAVLAAGLCLFGWPWLRRHPVAWLPSVDAPIPPEDEAGALQGDGDDGGDGDGDQQDDAAARARKAGGGGGGGGGGSGGGGSGGVVKRSGKGGKR